MPIQLAPFNPALQLAAPIETNGNITLQLAAWNATATVNFRNMTGKYKVGWVQGLVRQNIKAIYDNERHDHTSHRCECRVLCNPMPILDSGVGEQPWYFDNNQTAPEITARNPGVVTARPQMADRPSDPFLWRCTHGASAPLKEINYELSFRTWLAVQNITNQPALNNFEEVLYNFKYTIDSRLVIDITKPVGQRATRGQVRQPGIERYQPPLPIPDYIWKPVVANDSLRDDWVVMDIVRQ